MVAINFVNKDAPKLHPINLWFMYLDRICCSFIELLINLASYLIKNIINFQWAKEAQEAERLEKMLKIENEENAAANNLALAIQSRNEARASQSDSFFDSLIDKYAKKAEKTTKKKVSPVKTVKTPKSTRKTKKKA